jgi:excisionase family DNA binding protein
MSASGSARLEPVLPTEEEEKLALRAKHALSRHLEALRGQKPLVVKLKGRHTFKEDQLLIPASAARVLLEALSYMADGNAVMVLPIHREVSTQQAADLLNVSRPYLIRLLEQGQIAYRQVGTRRRVELKDVLAYRARHVARRRRTLDELTAQGEELGLY